MEFISRGRRLMVFVDGKAVALATNHTLNVNASLIDERTKDDGDNATASEFDYSAWTLSSDSIVGSNDNVLANEETAETMIDAMLALKKVNLVFDASTPVTGTVPAEGWAAAGDESYPMVQGPAYITSLTISSGSEGAATMSITFTGHAEV